jgi:2-polyprenyl-3-methyl-5-hydroxy-6-metoxy-1,4-benzoquinol methylase
VSHHEAGAAFWDERYRAGGPLWSGEPNPQLIAEVADLPSAAALDAGCGEGADAIWLAEHGWNVTAVDFSTVALDRAAAQARATGVDGRIRWVPADLLTWVPPESSYDLVTAQFVHVPADQRRTVHRRLAGAVTPGGTLLLVEHSPRDLNTTAKRPRDATLFTTASDIGAVLDPREWEIVVSEARPRQAPDPSGVMITVHDEILRARRRRESQ